MEFQGGANRGAERACPAERKILIVDKPGSPQTALSTFGIGTPREFRTIRRRR